MKRTIWVVGVILAFFLTLTLTLPEIQTTSGEQFDAPSQAAADPRPDQTVNLQAATPTPATESPSVPASPPPSPTLTTGEIIQPGIATPVPASQPVIVQTAAEAFVRPETAITAEVALGNLGEGNLMLKGLYSTGSLWIPLPSNWLVEYVQIDLHYVASPLLHPSRANLTVLANNQRVTSIQLHAGEHVASFVVPVDYIAQGNGFSLSFFGYLRITDLFCEESDNPGQWVNILASSRVTIGANPDPAPPDLKNAGRFLLAQNSIGPGAPILFVLPNNPDSTTLNTAAQVAARIGNVSGFAPLKVVTAESLTEYEMTNANMVIIGLPEDQPLLTQLTGVLPAKLENNRFFTIDNLPAPPDHGVVQIFRSPWNEEHNILLVSAGNEAGLALAGKAFASAPAFQLLSGTFQFIENVAPSTEILGNTPWLAEQTTLADLGYRDAQTTGGAGVSNISYYFNWPPGWILRPGAQLALNLAVSPAVEPDSHIKLSVNDVYIGAAKVDPNAGPQQFLFALPETLINETLLGERTKTMKMDIDVVNVFDARECRHGDFELIWVRVQPDSYFTLSHSYASIPDLSIFPYPFVSDRLDQPVSLVLPDNPTLQELSSALSLASLLGDFALGDLQLNLLTADQLSVTYATHHLIVLGERSRQPWVDQFLATLPDIPRDGVYQALENEIAGVLLEGRSPWSANRVVLLVFGESSSGFERAATALYTVPPMSESGSAIVFDAYEQTTIIGEGAAASSTTTEMATTNEYPFRVIITVEKGDSVALLAERYNSSIDAIVQANALGENAVIFPGQVLVIPLREAPAQ